MYSEHEYHKEQQKKGNNVKGTLGLRRRGKQRINFKAKNVNEKANFNNKKKKELQGHDAKLDEVKRSGQPVLIVLMSGLMVSHNVMILDYDRYTVTYKNEEGSEIILYKHAIQNIVILNQESQ